MLLKNFCVINILAGTEYNTISRKKNMDINNYEPRVIPKNETYSEYENILEIH